MSAVSAHQAETTGVAEAPPALPAPAPSTARVAVVVVTWNSAGVLDGLLRSLPDGLAGVPWSLTVVDNASADDTVARAEKWLRETDRDAEGTVISTGRNAGYAAAINAALTRAGLLGSPASLDRPDQSDAEAEADTSNPPFTAALILNPDVRLEPGCVARMLELLDDPAGPRAGIVVPRIQDEAGGLSHSLRREPSVGRAVGEAVLGKRAGRIPWLGEVVLDEGEYETATTADWATGAIMLLSARCLAECGPWDESFFLYSEETEFALRARDRGFATRIAPEAVAVHIGGESKTSAQLWTLLVLNRVKLYRRRHSAPASAAYWSATLLRELPRAALGARRSRTAIAALCRPSRLRQPDLGMH
jgi:N-acetylglucosaminyl-diphospho-decaprenol L-rhamnosyltransferase